MLQDVGEALDQIDRRRRLLLKSDGEKCVDQKMLTELSQQFSRTYPYQYLSNLFIKTTVSELKKKAIHDLPIQSTGAEDGMTAGIDGNQGQYMEQAFTRQLFEEPEIVPYIPSFISSKEEMSGTDRGSAYHKAMELLDLQAVLRYTCKEDRRAEISRQLDVFEREELLDSRWRKSISLSKLERFFESSLAGRMAKAAAEGKLRKEQPFVLGLSARRLGEQFPDGEQVLIQGIIDVFFEEAGKIVVADYKTDVIKSPRELIQRYQVQLDYYAEALARLTGREVTEKIIYSFALGKEIMLY